MKSAEAPILPVLPDSLVNEIYEGAVNTPRAFVKDVMDPATETRSHLLRSYLIDALRISAEHGEYDVLHYLRQVLLVPACFGRYFRMNKMPDVRVSKSTMSSLYDELTYLDENERLSRDLALYDRMRTYNPLLIGYLGQLRIFGITEGLPSAVQSQAYKKALRAFELYERQMSGLYLSSPDLDYGVSEPKPATGSVSVIGPSIIDRALLDIALDKTAFVTRVIHELLETNINMTAPIVTAEAFTDKTSYMLASCLINRVFMDEFNQRGVEMPTITADTINTIFYETGERLTNNGDPALELANARKFLKTENPHLHYGINLMEKVLGLDETAVGNAICHFYTAWRSQIEIDYCKRRFGS